MSCRAGIQILAGCILTLSSPHKAKVGGVLFSNPSNSDFHLFYIS